MAPACKYRFGPFELRTKTRELYKHGVKLKLRPQAYQVLVVLLERAGDGVTRGGTPEARVAFQHLCRF